MGELVFVDEYDARGDEKITRTQAGTTLLSRFEKRFVKLNKIPTFPTRVFTSPSFNLMTQQ